MPSLIFTSQPKNDGLPNWVTERLVGKKVNLCSLQGVTSIGFKQPKESIADMYNALTISPSSLVEMLIREQEYEVAQWFKEKFRVNLATPNGEIILVSRDCCKYNP